MHPNSSSPFPGETHYCLQIHPEVLCPFLRKLIFTHQCVQEAPLPFLGNFIAQHCIKEVLRPSMKNIFLLLTNSPRSASPFLGNFIAEHCIQKRYAHPWKQFLLPTNTPKKRLALSWEFHCSTLHLRSATPIIGKYFIAHQYTQEASQAFLGN